MTSEYKYKSNDIVDFKLSDDIYGKGIILGVSSEDVAMMGKTYIIKVVLCIGPVKIPNKVYPFDTIAVPELFLECAQ